MLGEFLCSNFLHNMKKIIFGLLGLLYLAINPEISLAQTTLQIGDMAFLGMYTAGSTTGATRDSLHFVLLVDVTANTAIRFADAGYVGGTICTSNEGIVEWKTTTSLSKGTVVKLAVNSSPLYASVGTLTGLTVAQGASQPINDYSSSGDQAIAFQEYTQGTKSYLTAISSREFITTCFTSCTGNTTTTCLPAGLTASNTIAMSTLPITTNFTNCYYDRSITNAITSGTKAALFSALCSRSNWSANTSAPNYLNWPNFTVLANALPEPTNYPTAFTVGTKTSTSVTLTWTDAVGTTVPTGYLVRMSAVDSNSIVPPVDGTPITTSAVDINVLAGTQTVTFNGLNAQTRYFFKIYPYTNSTTLIDYKTSTGVPVATTTTLQGYSIIQSEPFTNCSALTWTSTSLSDPNNTWICGSGYANINGYGGLTGQQNDTDWIISPAINMNLYTNEIIEFQTDERFDGPNLALYYSTNYSGSGLAADIRMATWTLVNYTIPERTSGSTFLGMINNTVGIDSITGPAVYYGFKYIADGTSGGSEDWKLDEINLKGLAPGGAIVTTNALTLSSAICVSNSTNSSSFNVGYTTLGSFNSGNVFTVQLSSSTGSFNSPVAIGSGTTSPISCIIPAGTSSGTGYRVRVVSSNPVVLGTDNGNNFEIVNFPVAVSNFKAIPNNGQITASWTNPTGCYDQVVVVAREGSAFNSSISFPYLNGIIGSNNTSGANSNWSLRNNSNDLFNLAGAGVDNENYIVYAGTGTSFNLSGLTNGSTYYLRVFTVSGTSSTSQWSGFLGANTVSAPGPNAGDLVFTEIHYNPKDTLTITDATHEFIEVYNASTGVISLRNVTITNGVTFTFPEDAFITPGEHVVVAQTSATYAGNNYQVFQWVVGQGLNNSGEPIVLKNASGVYIDSVNYSSSAPWPINITNTGSSIELRNYASDNNVGSNWGASINAILPYFRATPGALNSIVGRPTLPSSSLVFSSRTTNSFTAKWTRGDGGKRLVFVSKQAMTQFPADGASYSSNSVFGMGAQLSGASAVYDGVGDSVNVSGLDANTLYYVSVFEYNTLNSVKRYLTTSYLVGSSTTTQTTTSPTVVWAKSAKGKKADEALAAVTDANGNTYVVGYYTDTVVFGMDTLRSFGIQYETDAYIAKYDPNGNVLWARAAGGYYADRATGIALDAAGTPYVVGTFNTRIQLGTTFVTGIQNDVFVAKYSTNGVLQWAQGFGGASTDAGTGIAVSPSGSIYVVGYYLNSATFGGITLTSNGGGDGFLVKLNASGSVSWARSIGGSSFDATTAVTADRFGDVAIAGYFCANTPSVTGPFSLKSTGIYDAFVAKYDANGVVLWSKSIGGNESELPTSIRNDYAGNFVVAGNYNGSLVSSGINYPTGGVTMSDIFLARYNSFGTRSWLVKAGGASFDFVSGLYVDSSGNSYLTGNFNGLTNFGGAALASTASNVFVAAYDVNGNVSWLNSAANNNSPIRGRGITGQNGNIYFVGSFNQSTTIGANSLSATTAGEADSYIAKISNSTPSFSASPVMKASIPSDIDSRFRTEVIWYNLSATANNGWTQLAWNSDRIFSGGQFFIQYSVDGNQWSTISTEAIQSTEKGGNSFSRNVAANSVGYYRIAMVGKDGNFDYSPLIQSVAVEKPKSVEVQVFPNPSNGIFNLQFNTETTNTKVEVYGMNGQLVHTEVVSGSSVRLDLSNQANGMYFVKVSTADSFQVLKVNVLK